MKSVLSDFYDVALLSDAKRQLMVDLDNLDIPTKRPHIPSRRDGDGRLEKEVNDIMLLIAYADEQKLIDKLPKYVSDNPDDMPSLRLYDGDMNIIVKKYQDMDARMAEFGSALAAIGQEVRAIRQTRPHTSSRLTDDLVNSESRGGVNNQMTGGRAARTVISGNSNVHSGETETSLLQTSSATNPTNAAINWASVASTPLPINNRFSVLSSAHDDNDGYTVVSNHRVKRARQLTSTPPRPSQRLQQPQQPQQAQSRQRGVSRQTLRGRAATVRDSNITAARRFPKKAVFLHRQLE